MSTYGDPLPGIIADALALPPQEIKPYTANDLQTQQAEEVSDQCRWVTTERTFEGSIKSVAVVYGGGIDDGEPEQSSFASAPATPSYPKFEAAHSSYTFQSYAENITEPKMISPSWKTQIGVPSSPAVSNGLGFFSDIPANVQGAMADMKEKTGFVLVSKDSKASGIVADTHKLKSSEVYNVDRYQTPSPKYTSRFHEFGRETAEFTTPTKSKTGTGFTPLIKQTGQFSARQALILESRTANKSARKEKRTEQAKQAAAVQSPARPKKVARRQKKKITLYAFSQDQASFLLANIPNNPEYDIEVVLHTDSVQAGQIQPTARTPATPIIDRGSSSGWSEPFSLTSAPQLPTTPNNVGNGDLDSTASISRFPGTYEWNGTFEDIAPLMLPGPDSSFGPSSLSHQALSSPKIKLFIRTTQQPHIPAKEFTVFLKLPTELQLEVWKLALPGGRTIKLAVACSSSLPSQHTPIPAILQACHISRELALKTLHPSFRSANNANQYTYFDPRIDVLELTLPSAKHIATLTVTSLKASRDLTQHVRIPFKIYVGMPMWRAMAELVLAAPHKAWPAIKSWHFPGLPEDKSDNEDEKQVVEMKCVLLGVKRPDTVNDGQSEGPVRILAGKIKDKFEAGQKEWKKSKIQLGIRITYD